MGSLLRWFIFGLADGLMSGSPQCLASRRIALVRYAIRRCFSKMAYCVREMHAIIQAIDLGFIP